MKNTKVEGIKNDLRRCINELKANTPIGKFGLVGIQLYLDGYITALAHHDIVSLSQVKAIHKAIMSEQKPDGAKAPPSGDVFKYSIARVSIKRK